MGVLGRHRGSRGAVYEKVKHPASSRAFLFDGLHNQSEGKDGRGAAPRTVFLGGNARRRRDRPARGGPYMVIAHATTVCFRCGQPLRGRCGSCGKLRALVSDDELTDGTISWSFEVWQDGKNDAPVCTMGGFSSSGEAVAAAHEFIRHYVNQHLSVGRPIC